MNRKNDSFVVSTSTKDIFTVNGTSGKEWTCQDIFYQSEYGFFIPLWNNKNKTVNNILVVDVDQLKKDHKVSLNFNVKTVIKIEKSKKNYSLYELESLAYVKTNGKLVFSCNVADTQNKGSDRVEEITNTADLL